MNLLLAAAAGSVCVSDSTVVGQFMISRPIFSGPLIGFLTGDIISGLLIGMLMELIWITVIPMGGAIPADSTVVTVLATYFSNSSSIPTGKSYMVFLVLMLVPVGILFKKLDILHRARNLYFVKNVEKKCKERNFSYINRATYLSAAFFIFKAFLFLGSVMYIGQIIIPVLFSWLPGLLKDSFNFLFYIIPSVGLGTSATIFIFKKSPGGKDRRVY
ncbi:MAG: PTS sugar transporter subunit IIC [Elusimicrobiota bacterium]